MTMIKYISDQHCIACGVQGPNDIDHIRSRGAGGTDEDENLWILCRSCHYKKHHSGLIALIGQYPHLMNTLEEKGWQYDVYRGKWIRYKLNI